ncbi:MAG: response regulator [Actinomycetota bacterium]|nr:response regulator [Actinomycetota bacterium]
MTSPNELAPPGSPSELTDARILIVDDQEANVFLLSRILGDAGYHDIVSTTEPRQVVRLFEEQRPDLVLLDLRMPDMDGYAVLEQLGNANANGSYVPILVLTADASAEARERALSIGAKDFLTKPFDLVEVTLRIRNLLETRFLTRELLRQNRLLEERVRERTLELEVARVEALERLALAAEFRDDETGDHAQRVGRLAAALARAVGLSDEEVETIRRAAPLHDVGKIGVPEPILLKRGSLTPDEFEHVKAHTTVGGDVLSGGRSPVLRMAEDIARTHHERWDGGGYVHGLRGQEIPLVARIVALADVFDTLIHHRPYREPLTHSQALSEIERGGGGQFDPDLVQVFLRLAEDDETLFQVGPAAEAG